MIYTKIFAVIILSILLWSCGKIRPLSLPEDKLDKSIISYPCDAECVKNFEEEKKRQQSLVLQTN